MCGRYTHLYSWAELHLLMRLTDATPEEVAHFKKRYNVAPQQQAPVVIQHDGQRHAEFLRWGLIPSWAKDESFAAKTINARSETVAESPAFRASFKGRRCLVPVSGFYEWQAIEGAKRKQPWYFTPASGSIMCFAGLWDEWHPPATPGIRTFTILTTGANDLLKPIHTRMPVVLSHDEWDRWLDPMAAPDSLQSLLRPCDPGSLHAARVSTRVNSVAFDGPECIQPVGIASEPSDEQPGLFGPGN